MNKQRKTNSCHPELVSGSSRSIKGFTLIELLVVVLIIGILATVATSQYKKATERSLALTTINQVFKPLIHAIDVYYLAHGTYPRSFDVLDVNIPWTGKTKASGYAAPDWRSNDDWSVQIFDYSDCCGYGIHMTRLRGPYKGKSFWYHFYRVNPTDFPQRQIYCAESGAYSDRSAYCTKVMPCNPVEGFPSYCGVL